MEPEVTDKENLRLYLLGLASTDDQRTVEERLVSSQSQYDEIEIAEDELIDDYLADQLSETEHRAFATHFMNAPERREQLSFAQALQTYVGSAEADTKDEAAKNVVPLTRRAPAQVRSGSYLRYAAIAAGCLIVFGLLSWVVLQRLKTEPPSIIAVTLHGGGITREGGNVETVRIPNGNHSVQFTLPLPAGSFASYQAVLRNSDGATVFTSEALKSQSSGDDRHLTVLVPANLPTGDYQFVIYGISHSATTESIANYRFKIVRQG